MGKKPSDVTLLRRARSELCDMRRQRDALKAEAYELRTRANKAEQELAEWKDRFDMLLRRDLKQEVTDPAIGPITFDNLSG